MSGRVVADASPFIALERIGRLDLIPLLFGRVLVPPAVMREVGSEIVRANGGVELGLERPIDSNIAAANLDPGETEAIGLALEIGADQIVLDDDPARRLARRLGIPLIGTLGIVLAAKQRGVIPAITPVVVALVETGFRVDERLLALVIADAGET